MNLLCPNCQKMIQVSEQYAGQEVRCPLCNGTFTVPVLPQYQANPVAAAAAAGTPAPSALPADLSRPSPGVPPVTDVYTMASPEQSRPSSWQREEPPRQEEPKPARSEPPPPFPDSVTLPQLTPGYQHLHSIWISPRVVKWVPSVALFLVFVSMFSTWIMFVGRPDEKLSGWQIMSNGAGTMYVLLFILAVLLALAAAVLPRVPRDRVPPWVPQVLPWSSAIVGGVTLLAFLFLLLSLATGYGGDNAPEIGTGWLRFSIGCLIVGIVGAALDGWLTLRGPGQPLPRIDVTW